MEIREVSLEVMMHKSDSRWFLATDILSGMTVVGVSEIVPEDVRVKAEGSFREHRDYGRQFWVERFLLDSDDIAMTILLGSGILYGIGDHRAKELVKLYGAATFNILDNALNGVEAAKDQICAVKGIGKNSLPNLLSDWAGIREWARPALYGFKAGLSPSQVRKAMLEFKDIKDVICNSPYDLTRVRGISFSRADEIAQLDWIDKKPIPRNSPQRYAAAVRHILEQALNLNGHLCLPQWEAVEEAEKLISAFDIADSINFAEEGMVQYGHNLYLKWVERIETSLVASLLRIKKRSNKAIKVDPQEFTNLNLSPDQRAAISKAISAPITVITGGPGTGKTTCINTLLNILETKGMSYTLCAPTGKAAKRMEEATDRESSTIHRALGWVPGMDPKSEITTRYLIVDEASMIDTEMMAILLSSTPDSNVIFVGDANQLPPVGPGEPFMEIINSGVFPVARLDVIHRQGKNSGIVHAAHNINNGIMLEQNQTYDDFRWVQVKSNDELTMLLSKTIDGVMDKYKFKLEDLQILTPLNKRDFGQKAINAIIQEKYNPGPLVQRSIPFKVEDKVIHIMNNYELGVMNGEVGKVTWIATEKDEEAARNAMGGQHILPTEEKQGAVLTVDYGDKVVHYAREELADLKLAYAITIHKSQGSEFPAVIILVPHLWPGFELRQLVYTGITRARQYCLVLTPYGAIEKYIKNEMRLHRNTMVAERLQASK